MPALQRPAALATLVSGACARAAGCWVRSSSGTSSSPSQPAIAAKHPYQVDLKAGKLYAWCTCGHSKKQVTSKIVVVYPSCPHSPSFLAIHPAQNHFSLAYMTSFDIPAKL
ncbi:CDGSH iron-sulfur domain-containing protein 3, mitochondrial isoform X3 [Dermochelys coriacea]|uniref:CDGSH iron-sulfur domain-containing protein 3, mitochondrial isoform X3 n=1 Tax=Dermochelys coriacea TaxID=27794 RepID=UPI001CA89653|nr:CDGSH iron-sulfur domain-containing protein 3, mitochondrial isoform X3 [Dermochelys coriacea]